MDELKNEMTQEDGIEEATELMEVSTDNTPAEIDSETDDSCLSTGLIAGGIAVIGLATYGTYKLTKGVVIPGIKKGAGWIKSRFKKHEPEEEVLEDDFGDEDVLDAEEE